MYQDI